MILKKSALLCSVLYVEIIVTVSVVDIINIIIPAYPLSFGKSSFFDYELYFGVGIQTEPRRYIHHQNKIYR